MWKDTIRAFKNVSHYFGCRARKTPDASKLAEGRSLKLRERTLPGSTWKKWQQPHESIDTAGWRCETEDSSVVHYYLFWQNSSNIIAPAPAVPDKEQNITEEKEGRERRKKKKEGKRPEIPDVGAQLSTNEDIYFTGVYICIAHEKKKIIIRSTQSGDRSRFPATEDATRAETGDLIPSGEPDDVPVPAKLPGQRLSGQDGTPSPLDALTLSQRPPVETPGASESQQTDSR